MRRRTEARPAGTTGPITKQARNLRSTPGLMEAYCDDKFVSPTRFFTAAPEHSRLGKWAQPSTLSYNTTLTPNARHVGVPFVDMGYFSSSARNKTMEKKMTGSKQRRMNPSLKSRHNAAQRAPSSAAQQEAATGREAQRSQPILSQRRCYGSSTPPQSPRSEMVMRAKSPRSELTVVQATSRINPPISGRVSVDNDTLPHDTITPSDALLCFALLQPTFLGNYSQSCEQGKYVIGISQALICGPLHAGGVRVAPCRDTPAGVRNSVATFL